jgi:hypothetical protein
MAFFDWLAIIIVTACAVGVASYALAVLFYDADDDHAPDQPFDSRKKP